MAMTPEEKRERARLAGKRFRERHPERAKQIAREYHARNRVGHNIRQQLRRARMRNVRSDPNMVIRNHVSSLPHFCRWCGRDLTETEWHIDHVIPISRGGDHIVSNIVKACYECNVSRGSMTPCEWLRSGRARTTGIKHEPVKRAGQCQCSDCRKRRSRYERISATSGA